MGNNGQKVTIDISTPSGTKGVVSIPGDISGVQVDGKALAVNSDVSAFSKQMKISPIIIEMIRPKWQIHSADSNILRDEEHASTRHEKREAVISSRRRNLAPVLNDDELRRAFCGAVIDGNIRVPCLYSERKRKTDTAVADSVSLLFTIQP
ncbi:uncharacterized protein FOMMEDRAFT_155891 [Fomitiporia mediterranea MF3/22]|uniref:uncharacterized protein n=1 Tax=Fomitiporia mediterranea (strain MF3/22) TaxID=694068 RepID=UPI000440819E|nr:uncharacterized protein FOMMEDRAFT_155891 [Fomitiporia mediterranea MF3/22]EJD02584.1 hypothetical protein FOMMEDRAFT_155891 [Fomitiporia mediterranea MF3/22]